MGLLAMPGNALAMALLAPLAPSLLLAVGRSAPVLAASAVGNRLRFRRAFLHCRHERTSRRCKIPLTGGAYTDRVGGGAQRIPATV